VVQESPIGADVARVVFEDLPPDFHRLARPAAPHVEHPEVELRIGEAGGDLQLGQEVTLRLGEAALRSEDQRQPVVDAALAGVPLEIRPIECPRFVQASPLLQLDSIEEMRGIFNALGSEKRQEVADFVLTQLNIFKGTASTFSQHYNEQECLLE